MLEYKLGNEIFLPIHLFDSNEHASYHEIEIQNSRVRIIHHVEHTESLLVNIDSGTLQNYRWTVPNGANFYNWVKVSVNTKPNEIFAQQLTPYIHNKDVALRAIINMALYVIKCKT